MKTMKANEITINFPTGIATEIKNTSKPGRSFKFNEDYNQLFFKTQRGELEFIGYAPMYFDLINFGAERGVFFHDGMITKTIDLNHNEYINITSSFDNCENENVLIASINTFEADLLDDEVIFPKYNTYIVPDGVGYKGSIYLRINDEQLNEYLLHSIHYVDIKAAAEDLYRIENDFIEAQFENMIENIITNEYAYAIKNNIISRITAPFETFEKFQIDILNSDKHLYPHATDLVLEDYTIITEDVYIMYEGDIYYQAKEVHNPDPKVFAPVFSKSLIKLFVSLRDTIYQYKSKDIDMIEVLNETYLQFINVKKMILKKDGTNEILKRGIVYQFGFGSILINSNFIESIFTEVTNIYKELNHETKNLECTE